MKFNLITAKVMLFLSSEPVEMAHERKRQAQPRFGHPWRSDMNIIPVHLTITYFIACSMSQMI